MVVRMHRCPDHGPQPSKIVGRDGVPRCPTCGLRMEKVEYGVEHPPAPDPRQSHRDDPRRQGPPRGGRPL